MLESKNMTYTLETLMDQLWLLFDRLNTFQGDPKNRGNNLIEKYNYFITHSENGRGCTYALKSKELFRTHEYPRIKELILEIAETIRSLEEQPHD